jgi:phage shock protein A
MANPFAKGWKYLMALFGAKIDEYADPKIQIQQAVEEAQRQHQALTRQAAAVLGNQRQLEMKLSRQMSEVEKLHSSARQALVLADQHRAKGDQTEAGRYEQTATAFATQLVTAEQSLTDLKTLHDQALQAAEQAKQAVERNAYVLQQKLAERTRLLSQLEQARMQEQVAGSLRQMSELSAPGSTPSLTEVRDKIEQRYAVAMGQAELAQSSVEGRMLEVQRSTLEMAGASRLDEIRASLHGGAPQIAGSQAHPQLNQGGQQQGQQGQASLVKGTGNPGGTGSNGTTGHSPPPAPPAPPAPSQDGEQRR